MRAQIELLSPEIKELRDKLLMKGSEQFALASSNGNGTEVAIDPHLQWIEEHSVELRKHPRTWLAIHPRRGIVFHAQTADELEDQLDNLTPEERRELLTFNATPYA
jgi:hypothetical protein